MQETPFQLGLFIIGRAGFIMTWNDHLAQWPRKAKTAAVLCVSTTLIKLSFSSFFFYIFRQSSRDNWGLKSTIKWY